MATPNPTLNSDHIFTTVRLLDLLLCNVERIDLDNVLDDQGSGLKTADRWKGNYKLPWGSLDFPWITAMGLKAQSPVLLPENEIKWPQHMEAAKQWFIFMTFDEWFLI